MKHFIKKHAPHFGLWALSGLILLGSTIWLNHLQQRTTVSQRQEIKEEKITSSTSAASTTLLPPAKEKTILPPEQKNIASESLIVPPAEEEKKISVSFEFIAPSWSKDANLNLSEGKTVFEAMGKLVKENKINVEFKQFSGLGAFVQSIDGLSPKDNQYWIYYFNGKVANVGISLTKLKNNDVITWRYEAGKF